MGAIRRRPLKLYMKYDGTGKLISGSAIWRKSIPAGDWIEITQAYKCCNTTTTTTTSA